MAEPLAIRRNIHMNRASVEADVIDWTMQPRIPRRVRDDTVWEVSVLESGLCLRIRVRVDPFGWKSWKRPV